MAKWIIASLLGTQTGSLAASVRSLPQRVAVGECVDSSYVAGDDSLFRSQVGVFPSPDVAAAEADVTSADLISIKYGLNFKVLTEKLSMEQYVLTQCGTTPPTDAEVDAVLSGVGYTRKHFTIPAQRVLADSTTVISFFRRLGVEDRVAYISGSATHACYQKAAACGTILEPSWGNGTVREPQLQDVEVAFMDCSADCSALNARSNAVHVPATKDNGNLHSAEYVKFVAAFFNLEELAMESFQSTVSSYTALKSTASNGPIVAWVGWSAWFSSYVLYQATYRVQITEAAGGQMVNGTMVVQSVGSSMTCVDAVAGNPAAGKECSLASGDRAADARALLAALKDVDVLAAWLMPCPHTEVDETYIAVPGDYNYSSFLSNFYLTEANASTYKFLSNKKVLRTDGTISASNGWDWLESRVAYPDWAVAGLARYVQDDDTKRRMYFRNVAMNEVPEVVTADMCTRTLPVCDGSTAAPIVLEIAMSKSSMALLSFSVLCFSLLF